MPGKAWQITLDGKQHDLRVEHGTLLRKYTVTLDGQVLETKVRVIAKGSAVLFEIDNHECFMIVSVKDLFQFKYNLTIDVFSVDTGEQVDLPAEINFNKSWFRSAWDFLIWGFVFWVLDLIAGYMRRNHGQLFYGLIITAVTALAAYIIYKYYKSKETT